jgi:hypothetical protein
MSIQNDLAGDFEDEDPPCTPIKEEESMSIANLPDALAAEFEARFQKAPGSQPSEVEVQRWQQLCTELMAERERLRADFAKVKAERDQYLRGLYALTAEDIPFTREEVFASLEDLIKELESPE